MKKVNIGRIDNGTYFKTIHFSKAVLWKDRALSLPPETMKRIIDNEVKYLVFTDPTKLEQWVFKAEKVYKTMELKRVGQEDQYYFPIDLAKRIDVTTRQEVQEIAQEEPTQQKLL